MNWSKNITERRSQLGSRIKHLRREQRLSQAQLALMVGRDRSFISRIECGKCSATLDTIVLISDGLGIPPSELLADMGEPGGREGPPPAYLHMPRHV